MEKTKKLLSQIKQYIKTKKILLGFFIMMSIGILGGVLINEHWLNNSQVTVKSIPSPSTEIENGEVAGTSTDNLAVTPTPSSVSRLEKPKVALTVAPTPTSIPSGNSSSSNSSNEPQNSSPSPTPTPSPTHTPQPTPTPTPEPTPTPTPDTSPFEASMTTEGNIVTITANKPLQKCQWVAASTSGMSIVVSNNGDGADLISGNICTVENNNPQYSFGAKVTSIYGEEKILGNAPSNYW